MSQKQAILLAGAKGAGKSYIASKLAELLYIESIDYTQVRSNQILADVSADLLTCFRRDIPDSQELTERIGSYENLKNSFYPDLNMTGREFIIKLGTVLDSFLEDHISQRYKDEATNFLNYLHIDRATDFYKDLIILEDLRDIGIYNLFKKKGYHIIPIYVWNKEAEENKGNHWTETFYETNKELVDREFIKLENNYRDNLHSFELRETLERIIESYVKRK